MEVGLILSDLSRKVMWLQNHKIHFMIYFILILQIKFISLEQFRLFSDNHLSNEI